MTERELVHTQEEYGFKAGADTFPLMCVLALTYVCNAKCPSCVYTNSDIRGKYDDENMMSEEVFNTIADQVGDHSAWLRVSGGGEPLLHKRCLPFLEYAKSVGCKIGLITNGSRLDDRTIERLLFAGVDMIEVSVDAASRETYAVVRKGLKWDKLVRSVKKLVKRRNETRSPTKIIASGVNQVGVDIDKVAEFWEPLVDVFQKRKYLTWGINDPGKSADTAPYLPPEDRIPCPFLFDRLLIDTRGRVMVCPFDVAGRTDMGNVRTHSIAQIWRGDLFEQYRRMHLARRGHEIDLCEGCQDWQYRSWQHNYWKIVARAEGTRKEMIEG